MKESAITAVAKEVKAQPRAHTKTGPDLFTKSHSAYSNSQGERRKHGKIAPYNDYLFPNYSPNYSCKATNKRLGATSFSTYRSRASSIENRRRQAIVKNKRKADSCLKQAKQDTKTDRYRLSRGISIILTKKHVPNHHQEEKSLKQSTKNDVISQTSPEIQSKNSKRARQKSSITMKETTGDKGKMLNVELRNKSEIFSQLLLRCSSVLESYFDKINELKKENKKIKAENTRLREFFIQK